MAIDVRCGCGQVVYAEDRFAGQHVQCPHCRAAVAVPVAVAGAERPVTPTRETPGEAAVAVAGGVVGLIVLGACSSSLPPAVLRFAAIGALLAILGGVVVLLGGRRSDLFR